MRSVICAAIKTKPAFAQAALARARRLVLNSDWRGDRGIRISITACGPILAHVALAALGRFIGSANLALGMGCFVAASLATGGARSAACGGARPSNPG